MRQNRVKEGGSAEEEKREPSSRKILSKVTIELPGRDFPSSFYAITRCGESYLLVRRFYKAV